MNEPAPNGMDLTIEDLRRGLSPDQKKQLVAMLNLQPLQEVLRLGIQEKGAEVPHLELELELQP